MPISSWSTTPGSNNSAPPNGWPENMAPSSVNDTARQMMADIRTWYDTVNPVITAFASGTYTVTMTGVSGTVTGTASYAVVNDIVCVEIPSMNGTSTDATMTLTGMPAAIRPAGNHQFCIPLLTDNTAQVGTERGLSILLDTSGILTYAIDGSTTGFTATGTKGVIRHGFTYLRTV